MIVSALKREASTSRSRNWLADHRVPLPVRSGARSPWNLVSGNGPEWQRMQVVARDPRTSARPRAASPGAPVSEVRNAVADDLVGCEPLRVRRAGQSEREGGERDMGGTI